ncbi:MAG: alpha-hydroxy acid oxidase [Longimicrobiales bacterium]|nr:alpha-hydroxy acid oxidase [Longimicrobiales bacterium]
MEDSPRPSGEASPVNLAEIEDLGRAALSLEVYDYYRGGSEDERTIRLNRAAYGRWLLRPRRLVDVSRPDLSVDLLGDRLSLPVGLAPTAFQRLAHPEGELATARAARSARTLMVASTLATSTIEEIAEAHGGPTWLQLYVFRNRDLSLDLVRRAEACGCSAVCLTVDVPVQGKRERDDRNRFHLPEGLEMANFRGHSQAAMPAEHEGSGLAAFIHREIDPSLTWQAAEWLVEQSSLPVVVKGILTGEDAERAVERGARGIVVSNHGGRQLDGAVPTLVALPEVVAAVEGRVPVLLDGGIRRGTDVIKALALGARAVLLGRPYLWGLAWRGRQGVEAVLETLRTEVERSLCLVGRPRAADVDPDAVMEAPQGLVIG